MMSAIRPIGSIKAEIVSPWAMTTHEAERRVTPNVSAIWASAINTIPMLATIVKNERPIAVNAIHLLVSAESV